MAFLSNFTEAPPEAQLACLLPEYANLFFIEIKFHSIMLGFASPDFRRNASQVEIVRAARPHDPVVDIQNRVFFSRSVLKALPACQQFFAMFDLPICSPCQLRKPLSLPPFILGFFRPFSSRHHS